jgi:hypothetical protein
VDASVLEKFVKAPNGDDISKVNVASITVEGDSNESHDRKQTDVGRVVVTRRGRHVVFYLLTVFFLGNLPKTEQVGRFPCAGCYGAIR